MEFPKELLPSFCRRYHIHRLSLFGSAAKGQMHADSDIDLLVEFEQGHIPGFLQLASMERELSFLLGHPVDLRTPKDLSRYFRDEVLATAKVQYAAG